MPGEKWRAVGLVSGDPVVGDPRAKKATAIKLLEDAGAESIRAYEVMNGDSADDLMELYIEELTGSDEAAETDEVPVEGSSEVPAEAPPEGEEVVVEEDGDAFVEPTPEEVAAVAAGEQPEPLADLSGRRLWGAAFAEDGAPLVAEAYSDSLEGARAEADALGGKPGTQFVVEARTGDEALDVVNTVDMDEVPQAPILMAKAKKKGGSRPGVWKKPSSRLSDDEVMAIKATDVGEGKRPYLVSATGIIHSADADCRFVRTGAVDWWVGPERKVEAAPMIFKGSHGEGHVEHLPKGEKGRVVTGLCQFCVASPKQQDEAGVFEKTLESASA